MSEKSTPPESSKTSASTTTTPARGTSPSAKTPPPPKGPEQDEAEERRERAEREASDLKVEAKREKTPKEVVFVDFFDRQTTRTVPEFRRQFRIIDEGRTFEHAGSDADGRWIYRETR